MQDKLGLAHLVGTPMLKPYMHGFFVDARLHGKAKAAAAPFAYEEYRAQRVAQKLEEERKSRISLVKKAPKVGKTVGKMVLPGHRASRLARGLARCLRACSHGVGSTRPRAPPLPVAHTPRRRGSPPRHWRAGQRRHGGTATGRGGGRRCQEGNERRRQPARR